MKLLQFCLISLFHYEKDRLQPSPLPHILSARLISVAYYAAVASTAVATDEIKSCDSSADISNDEHDNACSSDASDHSNRPIWWNYSIDDLFEKYFFCSEILYGYGDNIKYADDQRNFEYDDDDDDSLDDDDDDDEEDSSDDDVDTKKPSTNSKTKTSKNSSETIQYSPEWWEEHRKALRQEWIALRDEYREKVNLAPVEAGEFNSVMTVPVYVGDAYEKGRGVFAAEPIKKGTLVSNTDNDHVGFFKDGHSWRKFAVSLPREMACNFIEWSWVQDMPPAFEGDNDMRNGLTIFVAFDESNLVNTAEWGDEEANIRCGSPPKSWQTIETKYDEGENIPSDENSAEGDDWGPCRYHHYATRDIAAGEEILMNYGEIEDVSQQGWVDIGL